MKFSTLFCIFIRSFFLEIVWNYERMQNVGFTFSIIPYLKKLYKDKELLAKRIKAHFTFFNTHPYFASIILGITARLEERYSKDEISSEEIIRNRNMLAGPVAAIGDRLIWSSWRVFCSVLTCGYFLLHGRNFYNEANIWIGVLSFLLIYNLVGNLPIRFLGVYFGYNYSSQIIEKISKFAPQKLVKKIRILGVVLLLIISFFYSISLVDSKREVIIFWLNLLISILISRKFSWVVTIIFLFIANFLLYWLVIR
ncbi:MAG: PTS system mannose/fructose/sorbose family transporter subunit IID [Elusimicrobiota bacterium]|nr:PTS system mannose/fructose/sorbose family transporter subunit IID [Endomicrobiia bacterium]MDW8164978.1 PTS system mannose/fructose/sorbose family transporter subunit IID [Elusimicrobiota bacterium]